MKNISPGGGPGAPVIRPRRRTCPPTAHLWYRGASPPMTPHNEGRVKSGDAGPPEPLYLLSPNSYLPQSRPASGGVSQKALLRFRLRASDFLGRQKVTKDRFKDPWSLKIPFPSNPAPCLPRDSALREPTRPSPACCRPWAIEGPSAPDDAAPRGSGHRSVGPSFAYAVSSDTQAPPGQRRRFFVCRVRP